jgi:CAAX protease family protein
MQKLRAIYNFVLRLAPPTPKPTLLGMRPFRALIIYLAFVFLGGALIAPWLWHFAQLFAGWFPKVAAAPFHRFLDRSFLFLALAGIWPLMRALGATSWVEVGLVPPYGQSGKLLGGLAMGAVSLSVVAVIEIVTGHRVFNHGLTVFQILKVISAALLTAVFVGTVEEILFRGAIFGGLRRLLNWPVALIISSMVYALTHFLQKTDIPGPVTWKTGFLLLPRLFDLQMFFPYFLCLTLVGVILALAYQATGNLYFSIGLHDSWIFVLKLYGGLTIQSAAETTSFWGTNRMADGWLTFFALIVTLAVFKLLPLEKRLPYTIA